MGLQYSVQQPLQKEFFGTDGQTYVKIWLSFLVFLTLLDILMFFKICSTVWSVERNTNYLPFKLQYFNIFVTSKSLCNLCNKNKATELWENSKFNSVVVSVIYWLGLCHKLTLNNFPFLLVATFFIHCHNLNQNSAILRELNFY